MSDFSVKQNKIVDLIGRLPKTAAELEPDKAQQGASFDLKQEVDSGTWMKGYGLPKTMPTDSYEFEDGSQVQIYDPTQGQDPSAVLVFRSHDGEAWFELSPDQDPI
jgi:hypothetical protein